MGENSMLTYPMGGEVCVASRAYPYEGIKPNSEDAYAFGSQFVFFESDRNAPWTQVTYLIVADGVRRKSHDGTVFYGDVPARRACAYAQAMLTKFFTNSRGDTRLTVETCMKALGVAFVEAYHEVASTTLSIALIVHAPDRIVCTTGVLGDSPILLRTDDAESHFIVSDAEALGLQNRFELGNFQYRNDPIQVSRTPLIQTWTLAYAPVTLYTDGAFKQGLEPLSYQESFELAQRQVYDADRRPDQLANYAQDVLGSQDDITILQWRPS
jgi:hypothetical protein